MKIKLTKNELILAFWGTLILIAIVFAVQTHESIKKQSPTECDSTIWFETTVKVDYQP
jgi:hypothetical protein